MKTSLVGQIFHFKPREKEEGDESPNTRPKPPDPSPGKRKGGRRSNRLFALHPVVVIKDLRPGVIENPNFKEILDKIPVHVKEKVKPMRNEHCPHDAPGQNEKDEFDKSEWHDTTWLETAPFFDDEVPEPYTTPTPPSPSSSFDTSTPSLTPATTPASSLSDLTLDADSPIKTRRPSLERRDAEINLNEKVVIVNITSQVHDYVDERNYLPIAAPGREYLADFEKRVFLAPVDSPESSPVTSPEDQDNWDTDSQWSQATIDTQYSQWKDPKWAEWEEDAAEELSPSDSREDRYLSNIPEIESLQPPRSESPRPDSPGFTEWSSDDIWLEQIPYIDDLMPQSVCLPRHDSYVRLDSRTTIPVGELEPFRRPAGGSYEIHPYSLDLLWQSVIECERGWRRPEESVLWDIECTAERQVEDIINEQASSTLAALQRQALAATRQAPAARVMQDFSRGAFILFQELRVKKKVLLKEIYTQLHTEPVLRPTQEKPFHEGSKLGEMLRAALKQKEMGIGEGEASLNTPIMSKLALKAKKLGEPPPSKKEEARARKESVPTWPHRSSSNPEAARPRIPPHPPFEHSKSATAIATQSQRPKATFHNEPPAQPRIQDKNWAEAPNWRGTPTPTNPDAARLTKWRSSFKGKPFDEARLNNTEQSALAPRVAEKPMAQPEENKKTHSNTVERSTSALNVVDNATTCTRPIRPVRTERGMPPASTMRTPDSPIPHPAPTHLTPTSIAKQRVVAPGIVDNSLAPQTQFYHPHTVGAKPQVAALPGSSMRPAPFARVVPSRGPQEKMSFGKNADRLPTKEEFLLILSRMPKSQQPLTVLGAKEGQQQGLNFNAQPGEVVQRRKSGVVVRGDGNPIIFAFVHKDQYMNHPRRSSFPRNNYGY